MEKDQFLELLHVQQSSGFQTLGDPFLEADIQHILMQRNC